MRKLLLIALTICNLSVFAQEPCGYTDYMNSLKKELPNADQYLDAYYQNAILQLKNNSNKRAYQDDSVYIIPVVFHVLYNNATENVEEKYILDQLEVLNDAYRHRHEDTGAIRAIFKDRASDVGIEFVLADKAPDGTDTNGITRTYTSRESFYPHDQQGRNEYAKKESEGGKAAWDVNKYLNIWICDLSFQNYDLLYGYALPPLNSPNWPANYQTYDTNYAGVVIHYKTVGRDNPYGLSDQFTKHETLIHEVGHYLGLRHTWGDASQPAYGCTQDDGIDDTPLNRNSHGQGCSFSLNTCYTANDEPDMPENYMDYSSHACQTMFTRQQVDLMRYYLLNSRSGLATVKYEAPPTVDTSFYTYNNQFNVYPNPYKGDDLTVKVVADSSSTESYTLELINLVGQVLVKEEIETNREYKYKFGSLIPGVYVIRFRQDGDVKEVKKIIVTRD